VEALPADSADAAIAAALLRATADSSDQVKARAAAALGDGPATPEVIQALCRLLTDDTAAVKVNAAQALGRLGPAAAAAAEPLGQALRTGEVELRRQVLRSLAQIDPAAVLPVAATALDDGDEAVRMMASAALLKVPELPAELVPALIEALSDPDVQVRSNA